MRMIDTSFAICAVCEAEHDCGLGYAPNAYSKIMWTCRECVPLARGIYGMDQAHRSAADQSARDHAGAKGGEYLETLGKFSLADLTAEEWAKFLDILFRERSSELRRLFKNICPPF